MKTPGFQWHILAIGALLVAVSLLSGCQTTAQTKTVDRIVERRVEVPKSLLTCYGEPVAGSVWVSQRDVARYLVRLAEAGQDCRVKLAAVRRILEAQ